VHNWSAGCGFNMVVIFHNFVQLCNSLMYFRFGRLILDIVGKLFSEMFYQ